MDWKKFLPVIISCLLFFHVGDAQHKHQRSSNKISPSDTVKTARKEMLAREKMELPEMKSLTSSFLPMNYDGSGTSWQPEETPISMWMKHADRSQWSLSAAGYI